MQFDMLQFGVMVLFNYRGEEIMARMAKLVFIALLLIPRLMSGVQS